MTGKKLVKIVNLEKLMYETPSRHDEAGECVRLEIQSEVSIPCSYTYKSLGNFVGSSLKMTQVH